LRIDKIQEGSKGKKNGVVKQLGKKFVIIWLGFSLFHFLQAPGCNTVLISESTARQANILIRDKSVLEHEKKIGVV